MSKISSLFPVRNLLSIKGAKEPANLSLSLERYPVRRESPSNRKATTA
jgi:hypothetical protein